MTTPPVSLRAALAVPILALALAFAAGPVSAQQSAPAKDRVVATVDGEKIMLSALQQLYADLPERFRRVPFERLYDPLLDQVIRIRLGAAKARAAGLDRTEAFRRKLRTFADRMLQQAYLEAHIDRTVTAEQLRKAYRDFVAGYRGAEEVRARHILVKTRKAALAVVEALDKGANFAELARKRSTGPSGARGGDLGWFDRTRMVKPFAEAAFALKKGAFTAEPVKTQFGWHIILLEDRRRQPPPPFEAKRAGLKTELGRGVAEAEIERLRSTAKIVRFGPDGKPLDARAPAGTEQ